MKPITYSLKANQLNSDEYYTEIKSFTNEILNEFKRFDTQVIDDYTIYRKDNSLKNNTKMDLYLNY